MANSEHLKILKQSVEAWNNWRNENDAIKPDLSEAYLFRADLRRANLSGTELKRIYLSHADLGGADLRRANLSDADLHGANLTRANLRRALLSRADFSQANFTGSDLRRADLIFAYLGRANLTGADLRGANLNVVYLCDANLSNADLSWAMLNWTNLNGANLTRANLKKARLNRTVFSANDLRNTFGLEDVIHSGPSSIGIDTIYMSEGKIPEVFLRGAGIPENFIQYMGSLTGKAFEFYSCFISYSNKDCEFAERLYADLQKEGVRCWFAPEDMKTGDKIRQRIDESIKSYEKLLLILSKESIKSKWVEKEVETAFEKETDDRIVLFPIRLDNAVMEANQAWAADIRRTRHIGDFTKWKNHDAYKKTFDRLLRDLKASG